MGRVDAQPSAGLEAERAVLGAMLIDESIVGQVLAEVDERDFTSTANRLIFQAAREVFREGGTPTPSRSTRSSAMPPARRSSNSSST